MPDTVVLDIDGTLVDTNYHHVIAWDRAFRTFDLEVPLWEVHRAIGMGGDRLVGQVAGEDVEARLGDDVRARWEKEYDELIDEIRPIQGARALLQELKSRGFMLVLASSGKKQHVETYLDLLEARPLASAWTTADDVDDSKPAPDLIRMAIDRVDGRSGLQVGDSVWDCRAALEAGVPVIAVLTGGFSVAELMEAGADQTFMSLVELTEHLDETALAGGPR